jgi:hypothetical protein
MTFLLSDKDLQRKFINPFLKNNENQNKSKISV